jgi:GT2 family glycosyltransferase
MNEQENYKSGLSIVLVNYKSFEMTSICLDLISKAVKVSEVPVWVVDNNSCDASLDYLKSLDWIHLIERIPPSEEAGFMAHGCALDLAMENVTTDFVLLLHTDTFIYDPHIINLMLSECSMDRKVVAVGCTEPVFRSLPHTIIRLTTRGAKYYFRRLMLALGFKSRRPKLHYEIYLKSFCALWNLSILKSHGMTFSMGNRVPGYEMQDQLPKLGYKFIKIPSREMFKYLDHIDKGTASARDGVRINHRKIKRYQAILNRTPSI